LSADRVGGDRKRAGSENESGNLQARSPLRATLLVSCPRLGRFANKSARSVY